ncbi:NUDIX domain-containing protein [Kitasatospora sp. MBT66]|uniref:NUDIX domain-containing protein n=1 Tax=Kitasatospora sp. MBT66 TaxID=1444769 RepID=UPI0007C7ED75|nr:NUDIX domain-containing protein [Kitasatospora sp. MBT66]
MSTTGLQFFGVQPRRRVNAMVLFRREGGDVLLLRPSYRPDWFLPGGGAHPGESIAGAAARELDEQLGLRRTVVHALTVDQSPANPDTWQPEGLSVVCDGGLMTRAEADALSLPQWSRSAIDEVAWVAPKRLAEHVAPYMEYRIRAALAAATVGVRLPLLYNGESARR